MKISYHARERRSAPFRVIKEEIEDGTEIEKPLARTLLGRAQNVRFKNLNDRFVLRKDLLGLYILTEAEEDDAEWAVVTHIDFSDACRQRVLKDLYNRSERPKKIKDNSNKKFNDTITLSIPLLYKYKMEDLEKIKLILMEENERFREVKSFPSFLSINIDMPRRSHMGDESSESHIFKLSKSAHYKATRVSIFTEGEIAAQARAAEASPETSGSILALGKLSPILST